MTFGVVLAQRLWYRYRRLATAFWAGTIFRRGRARTSPTRCSTKVPAWRCIPPTWRRPCSRSMPRYRCAVCRVSGRCRSRRSTRRRPTSAASRTPWRLTRSSCRSTCRESLEMHAAPTSRRWTARYGRLRWWGLPRGLSSTKGGSATPGWCWAGSRRFPGGLPGRRRCSSARRLADELFERVADAAVEGATPLAKNGYKVPPVKTLVRRALEGVTG